MSTSSTDSSAHKQNKTGPPLSSSPADRGQSFCRPPRPAVWHSRVSACLCWVFFVLFFFPPERTRRATVDHRRCHPTARPAASCHCWTPARTVRLSDRSVWVTKTGPRELSQPRSAATSCYVDNHSADYFDPYYVYLSAYSSLHLSVSGAVSSNCCVMAAK